MARSFGDNMQSTNNFPEFTGRLCPPSEKSCVLGIIEEPVAIENIEKNIIERGFAEGWIKPQIPAVRTGKTVAVIGSDPAGMAAAQQLNRAGHTVTVLKETMLVVVYCVTESKLQIRKGIIDRRVLVLEAEGIVFKTNVNVGVNYSVEQLNEFDSIVLCGGSTESRSLPTKE
jgi:glutamate synthase (NADPH/NADH) small chain